jgi:leucyl-tRNA synthetase
MRRYNPQEVEPRWQKIWRDSGIYKTDMARTADKYYTIPMLPYPSGDLHIGHWYNFGPADAVARFNRMTGQNVFTTIGFDAFGLPAENAAIQRGIQPAKWTRTNISSMTEQLKQIGASYDWDHSLATCDPDYYRWNQWLFLKLYEKGLAYRKKALVNWCPKDQTVLANEQVVGEDNVCERCGTPVVQRELEQWFYKITDYAERLLDDLEKVEWPKKVKLMQQNWIGRSTGALINFKIPSLDKDLQVFTTRPDTIFGATYMVIAPEHPLLDSLTTEEQTAEVVDYVAKAGRKTELERKEGEKDKTGVFTGSFAANPASKEKIPVWVADYVLMGYGTGAIMAVPAHDDRDYDFAKKYKLPIQKVINNEADQKAPYEGEGTMVNSGHFNGLPSAEAREKIVAQLKKEKCAKETTQYRLRDWLISRQRYWGTPIPIVYCKKDGIVPVPEDRLPVVLPEDVDFELTGQSPLVQRPDFADTSCPECGGASKRETDTMDTFMDSSWYFLRYVDNRNQKSAFDTPVINQWLPVDHYIGGIEHAILHLLYARFIVKFLHDNHGLAFDEPFKKLTNQGIILGPDGYKMSKSRGNVVSPDEQVKSYGADSLRLYLMFMGPYDQGGPYSLNGIAGTRRFLDRLWTLLGEYLESSPEAKSNVNETAILAASHRTIKKVTKDLEKLGFNTAIAAMMALVNELYKQKAEIGVSKTPAWRFAFESLTLMLAPLAPHISEEIWQELGGETSVHVSKWPLWDEALAAQETVTIAVQVNGKVRSEIIIDANEAETEVVAMAKAEPKIAAMIKDKSIQKEIYVPGRLVSLVID